MKQRQLGDLWPVSPLTISAAGLASIWGETPEQEGIATLHAALEAGINHIDVAPSYGRGRAEQLLGKAMSGGWPDGVKLTTKSHVGHLPPEEVLPKLKDSLQRSLASMGREQVDLMVLHSQLIADDWQCPRHADIQHRVTVPLSLFREAVVPAMQALVAEGLCAHWGITGIGPANRCARCCTTATRPTGQRRCSASSMRWSPPVHWISPTRRKTRRPPARRYQRRVSACWASVWCRPVR